MIASKDDFPKLEKPKKIVLTSHNLKEPETLPIDYEKKLNVITTRDIKERAAPESGNPKGIKNVMITTHGMSELEEVKNIMAERMAKARAAKKKK